MPATEEMRSIFEVRLLAFRVFGEPFLRLDRIWIIMVLLIQLVIDRRRMMERILLINGITPYLYFLAVKLTPEGEQMHAYKIYLIIFLIQLLITTLISGLCKDKKRLAKVTMINKFIQIPYFVLFFVFSIVAFLVGMGLMGIGILFLPFLIAIDLGVFLSTVIPEEICTIKLKLDGRISIGKFLLYFVGNAFYVVDIILAVLINKEFQE